MLRARRQPCKSVIDCEFKPCFNTVLNCNNGPKRPFLDKYCAEQQEWWKTNCCRAKPTCCRRRDRNKEMCEKLGFHQNWACIREQILRENCKTMEALSTSKPGSCFQWKYGNPYYSLTGPVHHPPGMDCTDYSLYIPTERLTDYCNRNMLRFRKYRKKLNKYPSYGSPEPQLRPACGSATIESPRNYNVEIISADSNHQTPNDRSNRNLNDTGESSTGFNRQPDMNPRQIQTMNTPAVQDSAVTTRVQEFLEKYASKFESTTKTSDMKGATGNEEEASGEPVKSHCPNCKEVSEDACRKEAVGNNGNHFADCTCRLCNRRRAGNSLSPKITDAKAERCKKLWSDNYQEPCPEMDRPCKPDPPEEINPETGDIICTKCMTCPCPVCCKQRAYAKIKPHHYQANGLSHPDLRFKKMKFLDRNNNAGATSELPQSGGRNIFQNKDSITNEFDPTSDSNPISNTASLTVDGSYYSTSSSLHDKNPKEIQLDPSKFRYNDEGVENAEYFTGDCVRENPKRKSFGLDVTYRQCCCSEPFEGSWKKCPSFVHAGTQYCHFPHPLDVEKAPGKCGPMRRRKKKSVRPEPEPRNEPMPGSECECDLLPEPNDYNTTTYRASYPQPLIDGPCNKTRYGSIYNPLKRFIEARRDYKDYDPRPDAQGDGDCDGSTKEKSPGGGKTYNTNYEELEKGLDGIKKCNDRRCAAPNTVELRRVKWPDDNDEDWESKLNCGMFQRYLSCCKY